MSSSQLNIHLKVTARDAQGNVIGTNEMDNDIANDNLANALIVGLLAGASGTFKGTDLAAASVAYLLPFTAFEIDAGTSVAAVARNDSALTAAIGAPSGVAQSVVVNAGVIVTGGSFTITGFFQNTSGGPLTYGEVGIVATDTTPNSFLFTHDRTNGGTGFAVPDNGTMDVAYTVTYS